MLHPGFYRPSEKPTASAERALATISILQQESTLRGHRFPFHCTTLQPCNQPAVDITTPAVGRGRVTCVSPGICANDGCDYTAEVEPDQDRAGARAAHQHRQKCPYTRRPYLAARPLFPYSL